MKLWEIIPRQKQVFDWKTCKNVADFFAKIVDYKSSFTSDNNLMKTMIIRCFKTSFQFGAGRYYPMRRKTPCFSYGDIRRVHRIYASN